MLDGIAFLLVVASGVRAHLCSTFTAAANSLTAGGKTKACLLLTGAVAASTHHSTDSRRATTLNGT